jgi:hypothetical protein
LATGKGRHKRLFSSQQYKFEEEEEEDTEE